MVLGLWTALSWWGERSQRVALAELLQEPTARERLQEQEILRLRADRLRLEKDLLAAEQDKQRAISNLAKVVKRLQANNLERELAREVDRAAQKQQLRELEENLALVQRINGALRRNGGGWLRMLSLESRDGKVLRDVMLNVVGQDGLSQGSYLASSCKILMDRESGRVRLLLGKGIRFALKKKLPYDDGLELAFESHWPRLFAKDLHELITFEGEWPKPKPKIQAHGDLKVLRLWRERLDAFFEALAVKGPRLELQDLKGVGLGDFDGVSLFGYTKAGILERRMKASRMEFWIDKDRDRVELRLMDGYVEDEAGRVEFPKKTWRMVLPGMGARQAGNLLAGYVRYAGGKTERH